MDTATATPVAKRVSWGAIFAGVAIALATQVLLGVLGIAFGASVIDPLREADPMAGIAIGSGIWFILSFVLSLLAGGFAAGALAVAQDRRDRTLHGLATWALSTLLLLMLLSSAVGRIIGGTMSLVGQGLSQAGQAASALAQPLASGLADQLRQAGIDLDLGQLRQQASELLRDTDTGELQPDQLQQEAQQLGQRAVNTATRIARNPQAADEQIQRLFDRIQSEARETLSAADQEALVNVLVENTDMSREEARQTVNNWQQSYDQAVAEARAQWEQWKNQAEQQAREFGEAAADAAATAAWWTFFTLVLGAIAAAAGANIGSNRLVVTRGTVR